MASVMFTAAMDVQINTGVDSTNYFCGGQLNAMSGAESGVVRCKFYLYCAVRGSKPGKIPIVAARHHCRLLFFKIEVRPRSCRSYHIWRP